MARIVNRDTSTVTSSFVVDTDALGPVILMDDVRPLLGGGEQLRSQFTGERVWVATLQVPGMDLRDADGGFAEVQLRMEGEHVPQIEGPCFVELGDATVSASNSRQTGGRRGSLRIKAASIRQTDTPPDAGNRSGIPVRLPEVIRWMGAAQAKGFGGAPRLVADRPVYMHQLLADEQGVRKETGEVFTARRPLVVEIVGDRGQALTPLALVDLVGVGAQVQVDDFGKSARLTLTADAVRAAEQRTPGRPTRNRPRADVAPEPVMPTPGEQPAA